VLVQVMKGPVRSGLEVGLYCMLGYYQNTVCKTKPSQISNWGGDLRKGQVDVPLSVSHSRV